jgi:mediator of RNA polymerase II transcription subunit 6
MEPEHDLPGVSYIFHQWLQWHGPLTKENVLDYFAESPFYDRDCNNEVCKKQNVPPDQIEALMKTMKGKEYVLVFSNENPRLFVIRRQIRESLDKVKPTGLYYVIEDTVYQAPSLLSLLHSRMVGSLFYLHNSFRELSQFFDFDPLTNYKWSKEKART